MEGGAGGRGEHDTHGGWGRWEGGSGEHDTHGRWGRGGGESMTHMEGGGGGHRQRYVCTYVCTLQH